VRGATKPAAAAKRSSKVKASRSTGAATAMIKSPAAKTSSSAVKKPVAKKAPAKAAAAKPKAKPYVNPFQTFAMHANNPSDKPAFKALSAERPGFHGFAMAASTGIANTDPETIARQYLLQSLGSQSVPAFTAPSTGDADSEFKSLGTETLPLTDTKTVKFRQYYKQVPIYSSLVTVELDEKNEFLAINSALGTPKGINPVAKISPADAMQTAIKLSGVKGNEQIAPQLNYYFDDKGGKWRLVYIIEDVRVRRAPKKDESPANTQFVVDFVIDAHSGALVAELPRTPTMAGGNEIEAVDGLGRKRRVRFRPGNGGGPHALVDEHLNVQTFDFGFDDPDVKESKLPGKAITNPPAPWAAEAVSAHANATAVAMFLRDVLKRNNIDNQGGALVSTVNCVVKDGNPLKQKQWMNAFWTPTKRQMVYGQVLHGDQLRSLAVNLDVVGHEMFHGVTNDTSRLEYRNQSGALNESYSDIFGVLISNFDKPDIAHWEFEIGENLTSDDKPLRDLSKPSRFNQPEHMDDFLNTFGDNGGVHTNSGIPNFAAFKIITAQDGQGKFLFTPKELAAVFYIALTQHLTRQSDFSASRRGVTLAAQTLFRNDAGNVQAAKLAAINQAFDDVGIEQPD
jgi:Zn-dependent metalloprotease